MNSYVERLLISDDVYKMTGYCQLMTDRMLANPNVTILWLGYCNQNLICITPDEAKILFAHNLLQNVIQDENNMLRIKIPSLDTIFFEGAIVCGILAPCILKKERKGIIQYIKKIGNITETMVPVKMLSGTKSLYTTKTGSFEIFFNWNNTVLQKIDKKLLHDFSKNFFSDYTIEIKPNGIFVKSLSEYEVFSEKGIFLFKDYDMQLFYLNSNFDKILLLQAVMQRDCIRNPQSILKNVRSAKDKKIVIPQNKHKRIHFDPFGKKQMNCGILHYSETQNTISYLYQLSTSYSEYIRQLMIDISEVMKAEYIDNLVYIIFSPYEQNLLITVNSKHLSSYVERDFIRLDYAITLLKKEKSFHPLYSSIISLLEADSSELFKEEYFSYLKLLKRALPKKWML